MKDFSWQNGLSLFNRSADSHPTRLSSIWNLMYDTRYAPGCGLHSVKGRLETCCCFSSYKEKEFSTFKTLTRPRGHFGVLSEAKGPHQNLKDLKTTRKIKWKLGWCRSMWDRRAVLELWPLPQIGRGWDNMEKVLKRCTVQLTEWTVGPDSSLWFSPGPPLNPNWRSSILFRLHGVAGWWRARSASSRSTSTSA